MVFGGDHGVCTGAVCHAQAGAQVVRIGHAVQHQQQGCGHAAGLQLLQQFIERGDLRHRIDTRHHTLMAMAAGHFGQS